jgi:NAD(P)-dependent dehydrogenase (short-subunit alcohol dehydrogenase family)
MPPETTKVLVTGAAGNIGGKVRAHLTARGGYELTLLDIDPGGDPAIIEADLSRYDEHWVSRFEGIDVVVHLAAEARPWAPWGSLERHNIDTMINVYEAALAHGRPRVVYSSSIQTMLGHPEDRRLTDDLDARPRNMYGAAKIFAERLGFSYAERHGLSVICLRIGAVRSGDNEPGPHHGGIRAQQSWLSNRDLCHAIERAITVEDLPYAVLTVVSDNPGMPWDLSETRRVLGYEPRDGHVAVPLSPLERLRRRVHRMRRHHRNDAA